jgi:hypothetical protein
MVLRVPAPCAVGLEDATVYIGAPRAVDEQHRLRVRADSFRGSRYFPSLKVHRQVCAYAPTKACGDCLESLHVDGPPR